MQHWRFLLYATAAFLAMRVMLSLMLAYRQKLLLEYEIKQQAELEAMEKADAEKSEGSVDPVGTLPFPGRKAA